MHVQNFLFEECIINNEFEKKIEFLDNESQRCSKFCFREVQSYIK